MILAVGFNLQSCQTFIEVAEEISSIYEPPLDLTPRCVMSPNIALWLRDINLDIFLNALAVAIHIFWCIWLRLFEQQTQPKSFSSSIQNHDAEKWLCLSPFVAPFRSQAHELYLTRNAVM